MQTGKIEALMAQKHMTFSDLAQHFTMSKQTLTKKLNGTLDWTYSEIMVLVDLFDIQDINAFFFEP